MESKLTVRVTSEVGNLILSIKEAKLVELSISQDNYIPDATEDSANPMNSHNIEQADHIKLLLQNYFSSATSFASIDLLPTGTPYQKRVWNELCKIPPGETRSYGEIAKKLSSSARAVGNACRKNPIAIIIPCHRVIAANGIGGYAGKTGGKQLNIKYWLLNHEGVHL